MRAVNLIPSSERRGGGGGAGGRSGGAVYVVLGALAVLVVMMGAYVSTGKALDDRKAELAEVKQAADAAQAKASELSAYTQFSALREKRVQTVTSLAANRFDWSHALHEVARVIPSNAWLTTLVGTVKPGVNVEGGGASTGGLRGAIDGPAIEVSGCTTSQSSVAKMLARMRLIDGVQRVALSSSEKGDANGGGSGGGAATGGGDCRAGSDKFPKFDLVVFFNPVAAPVAAPASAPATAAQTTPAPAPTP